MSVNLKDPTAIIGANVLGAGDTKLGKVDNVFLDNETGAPEWAVVKSGMLGKHVSMVPLAGGDYDGTDLRVPYDKDTVAGAPDYDPERELTGSDEQALYRHYQLTPRAPSPAAKGPRPDRAGEPGVQGHDTSGPTTDDAMTRSEQQLRVGTNSEESGKARLRKHIVTENVTQTVPVSHEEVTVEREPITEANRDQAMSGGELTEEEHEVTLHEEKVVTQKETVPVERVRLGTETVTGEQTVTEQVGKEQIETETTNPRGGKK